MKTMSVREFLRGEYRKVTEPTLVMSYSQPIGIWNPVTDGTTWSVNADTFSTANSDEVEWTPNTQTR